MGAGASSRVDRAVLGLEVFEHYPYGILLVDRHGTVLAHNAKAAEMLGDRASELDAGRQRLACDLVGCGVKGGPLEGICLFERAASLDDPLPEVRVDLPAGAGAPAVWVTAARLRPGSPHVILELRPGAVNDRRKRTEPHWTSGPSLRIAALGRTKVDSAEGDIGGRWLENRPGQLLKFLIAERHRSVYGDEIAEKLWPDVGRGGLQSVRYYVHELRDRLEPGRRAHDPSSFLLHLGAGYQLDRRHVQIDADEFERLVDSGLACARRDDHERACEQLSAAMALYRGDFLAEEPYADWAQAERDRLRALGAEALRVLTPLHERHGNLPAASATLERLIELEPFDVDVHRELIALALRRGRRTEAVRRYSSLRQRMLTTFGEDVAFTLADLTPVD
jgi:DNA-binding SARP family transcriptional activator